MDKPKQCWCGDVSKEETKLCRQVEEAIRERKLCSDRFDALKAEAAKSAKVCPSSLEANAMNAMNRAEQEQTEISRLDEKCRSLYYHLEPLVYELQLYRLKRNDPNTTVVNVRSFPLGHGQALGEALLKNTMVQVVDLILWRAFPRNENGSISSNVSNLAELLQFFRASKSLVNLRVVLGGLPPE